MSAIGADAVRRYLLGVADETEAAALERNYFDEPETLDEVASVEDELVEDYLEGRLEPGARQQFERHYLASPRHRARVEAIRRLLGAAQAPAADERPARPPHPPTIGRSLWWPVGAAAALAMAAGAAIWFSRASSSQPPTSAGPVASPTTPAPQSPPPTPPRVLAFAVPPAAVRSGDSSPSLVIPDGIDVVALDLEVGDGDPPLQHPRGVVRTVMGDEVWSSAARLDNRPVGIAARLEVPASRLAPDDYTIGLIDRDAQGRDRGIRTYFLRVRRP